jgi:hypothetical protein
MANLLQTIVIIIFGLFISGAAYPPVLFAQRGEGENAVYVKAGFCPLGSFVEGYEIVLVWCGQITSQ